MGDGSVSRPADTPSGAAKRGLGLSDESDHDVELSSNDRELLLDELASLYSSGSAGDRLLRSLGVAPHEVSGFVPRSSATDAWSEILVTLEHGKIAAPRRHLIVAGLRDFPANPRLLALAGRYGIVPDWTGEVVGDLSAPGETQDISIEVSPRSALGGGQAWSFGRPVLRVPALGPIGIAHLTQALSSLPRSVDPPSRHDEAGLATLRARVTRLPSSDARLWVLAAIDALADALAATVLLRRCLAGRTLYHEDYSRALFEALPALDTAPAHPAGPHDDIDYVTQSVLFRPDHAPDHHRALVTFALSLCLNAGVDIEVDLTTWAVELVGEPSFNVLVRALRERRTRQEYRLILSVDAPLAGDWPETLSAWLVAEEEVKGWSADRRRPARVRAEVFTCATQDQVGFDRVVRDAVLWSRGVVGDYVGQIDLAAPAWLLATLKPETIVVAQRLGVRYRMVARWNDLLHPPTDPDVDDPLWTVMRQNEDMISLDSACPVSWLREEEAADLDYLLARLQTGSLGAACGLRFCLDNQPEVLDLLLRFVPILVWPEADETYVAWHEIDALVSKVLLLLPEALNDAYRRRWQTPADKRPPLLSELRAVWNNADWLAFCEKYRLGLVSA